MTTKELNHNKTGTVQYYTVTLSHVRSAIVAMEKQKYYIFRVCMCGLRYPVCNTHASYCHLWPAWFCSIFPHYFINGTIFEKKKY